jgi:hypothetical protein
MSEAKFAAAALGFALVVETSDMMVVLFLSFPAAPFLDPPLCRRSGDFIGRARWSYSTLLQPI